MLVRLFRSPQPVLLLVIPAIAILLWLPGFRSPVLPTITHQMPLFDLLAKPLLNFPVLSVILACTLIIIQALLFNYIIDKHEIVGKSSYFPAFLYIVFTSFSPELLHLHPLIFANIFILLALNRVLSTYRNNTVISPCFDAGFLVAIASLFYFPAALCIFFLFFALLVLRSFSGREWAIVVVGFLLPYIYVITYYFLFDGIDYLWFDKISFPLTNRTVSFSPDIAKLYAELVLYAAVTIVLLAIGKGLNLGTRSVQHRSTIIVLRWLFIFGTLTLLVSPNLNYIYFFIALIPLLMIVSGYFLWARLIWLAELLLWMILLTIFYNHFATTL